MCTATPQLFDPEDDPRTDHDAKNASQQAPTTTAAPVSLHGTFVLPSAGMRREWMLGGALILVAAVVAVVLIVTQSGSSPRASGPPPEMSFGPTVRPVPEKEEIIYTNGWAVTNSRGRVAVFAGSERADHRTGVLHILRHTPGATLLDTVTVSGSGAVTLVSPPHPASLAAADRATLPFVTADGRRGTFNVATERVSLGR